MEKIRSKISGELLHVVCRMDNVKDSRLDLSQEEEALQVAAKRLPAGEKFPSHIHIENNRITSTTQESWVVVKGSVSVDFYDVDKIRICSRVLNSGDCSVSFGGGHGMEILENDTILYEFKNGPYVGKVKDKVMI